MAKLSIFRPFGGKVYYICVVVSFENENSKVEKAESVCKIQQNLFADYHVQFLKFALIADIWENLVFSGPWGKVYYAFQHLVKTQIYSSLDLLLYLLIQCTTCPFEQAQNWKFNKLKFKMETTSSEF